ncbi:MAG: BON domain-containing protein [Vicinamibacteria bacterium]
MTGPVWLAASALVVAAATAYPQTSDRQKELEEAVWTQLKKAKLEEDVAEVVVANSVVTLRGKPRNAYSKMKAIEAALSVEGIESVESDLEVAEAESDEDFQQDLVDRVLTYPHYTVFDDVSFMLHDEGAVTLGGYVTMPFKKDEIEERVGKVRGVRELKSEIQVLPVSPSDDRLREILFERIYGNDLFTGYAQQAHPPIHIIVQDGNVMLTGAVRSNVEKRQAESIVRSTFGVFQVMNRLTVNP